MEKVKWSIKHGSSIKTDGGDIVLSDPMLYLDADRIVGFDWKECCEEMDKLDMKNKKKMNSPYVLHLQNSKGSVDIIIARTIFGEGGYVVDTEEMVRGAIEVKVDSGLISAASLNDLTDIGIIIDEDTCQILEKYEHDKINAEHGKISGHLFVLNTEDEEIDYEGDKNDEEDFEPFDANDKFEDEEED